MPPTAQGTKEEGQMVESQYGTNTNTNALIQLVAKVPIGIIPIAVQGEKAFKLQCAKRANVYTRGK